MGTAELIELVSMGGHGVAALMYMVFREERKERIRYRNFHEKTIEEYPKVALALHELSKEVNDLIKKLDK